ncbi:N-acetyltransferase 8-like [Mesocricetus auratus]|uniref:N-acetyltransferase 8-like n=1 Tax=Mesocricetus auratus TaxID=10036 RepID=A0A1U8BQU3_MESAU|nr:N-acetyltransferase 8-like [Mesocricetus auratus]XP_012969602.1 N-acetyltransferase 8-like [Mesocricetus auratus]XP_012969603.1 N-acetyltransferase 8-like [Mesocricetus auratus]
MTPHHIRQYQERDHKQVLDLFSRGMEEHIPTSFYHALMLPRTLLVLLGMPTALVLVSGSWMLAIMCIFFLLLLLWLLARQPLKKFVNMCLHTDLADITKSYLSDLGSCFLVAETEGQVVGLAAARPVQDASLKRKQLLLFHLSVSSQHRGQGIAKALIRAVLQFARNQGYSDVVLRTSMLMHDAVTLYKGMGFQKTGTSFFNTVAKLLTVPSIHFSYPLPSGQELEF